MGEVQPLGLMVKVPPKWGPACFWVVAKDLVTLNLVINPWKFQEIAKYPTENAKTRQIWKRKKREFESCGFKSRANFMDSWFLDRAWILLWSGDFQSMNRYLLLLALTCLHGWILHLLVGTIMISQSNQKITSASWIWAGKVLGPSNQHGWTAKLVLQAWFYFTLYLEQI